ncbi:GNAT family N-acetyltransferase [Streptomyces sp. NPDC006339]|uniref:GNAT family N-acetyltransferase n=1 Tax=Streptomyces sp. NPDC006339 TaxID=3156755 RepID=UPI0033B8EBDB
MLALTEVADDPLILTSRLTLGFLGDLSGDSRRLSTFDGYDLATASELCDAIARYDKLRLVLEEVPSGRIVGLFEFSFDLHTEDIARYREAGIRLAATDCRFGPTLADDYQGRGVGTQVFPLVTDVARRFGRKRIILWGGVLADNPRAIRYYQKNGFQAVGPFTGADGVRSLDMILDLDSTRGP